MDRNVAQSLTIAVCGIVGAWTLIHMLNSASPGTMIGFALGGIIGVVGFASGLAGGALGVAIGVVMGGFLGSGMYKLGETLSYQVGRASEERMAALLHNQMKRITGQSEDEN